MDFIALFKDFGYPAIVTGVLLWMMSTKMEKLISSVIDLTSAVNELKALINETRSDVKDNLAEIKEVKSLVGSSKEPTKRRTDD